MAAYTFDQDLFSDLYKDVNGCRPISTCEFYNCNDARKQEIWDSYIARLDEQIIDSMICQISGMPAANQEAIDDLEARIATLIESGAGDRETALRWLFDDKDEYDSVEYVLWSWGINDSSYAMKLSTEYDRAVKEAAA